MPNDNGSFGGKVAFVTGAANGIGRAAALAFARAGASVIASDVSEQALQETVRLVKQAGGSAIAVKCDVSREEEIKTALDKTVEAFGRLDYAFNNAGVEHQPTPAAEITAQEWDRIINVDLRGVFLCMKHEIPLMLQQGGGAIVNTGSGASVKGIAGQGAYCAAKWGLIGLTKATALDYANRNVRVNAVCPGYVDTPMMQRFTGGTPEGRQSVIDNVPAARPASPEEIAAAAVWLCSDASSYVIGHAMVIDGGQTV
jgi:NAD(P)-dependent dehydrogenase (short-subunit alcohol dehydrogenase family)